MMFDIPDWLGSALEAASKRRDKKTESTPPNYETGFLIRWLEDEAVLRRVRNLMAEIPDGPGKDEQGKFNYAVLLEFRAAQEKAGDDYLTHAVFKAFSHHIQWNKLYAQTVAKTGQLLDEK